MIEIIDWGLADYRQALKQQEDLVAAVAGGKSPDTIIFCSHPPVVTIGRVTPRDDYAAWTGELVEVSRGGRATYHGPNQIVVYPIINLNRERRNLSYRDLHAYLRLLGDVTVRALSAFGIEAEYKQGADPEGAPDALKRHLTGVWVGPRKIASIGVAARQWVTYHGLALNVESSGPALAKINPCGFSAQTMTSMCEVLGVPFSRHEVQSCLAGLFANSLK